MPSRLRGFQHAGCSRAPARVPQAMVVRECRHTAVVNSVGSAACLRCWPMGDNGVLRVGMLLVVKRRCRVARPSAL